MRCEAYEDLVQEVLDELLLERSRREEAMEIGAEQFGDEITVRRTSARVVARTQSRTYMSSRGEMKMSLRLMTFSCLRCLRSLSSR
jgi:hypothetical protein